jgi:hypothetical protein
MNIGCSLPQCDFAYALHNTPLSSTNIKFCRTNYYSGVSLPINTRGNLVEGKFRNMAKKVGF